MVHWFQFIIVLFSHRHSMDCWFAKYWSAHSEDSYLPPQNWNGLRPDEGPHCSSGFCVWLISCDKRLFVMSEEDEMAVALRLSVRSNVCFSLECKKTTTTKNAQSIFDNVGRWSNNKHFGQNLKKSDRRRVYFKGFAHKNPGRMTSY